MRIGVPALHFVCTGLKTLSGVLTVEKIKYTVRGLKLQDENDVRTRRDAMHRVSTPHLYAN
jgi:hypothetical protein